MIKLKKNFKRKSKKLEESGAKDIGGRVHAGSGNTWSNKSDFSNENYLVEDKFTEKNFFSVTLSVLTKLESQAKRVGKIPILRIVFEPYGYKYAILRECDCTHMIDAQIEELETFRKSIRLKREDIGLKYLDTSSEIFIISIVMSNKRYYVLRWEEFLIDMYNFVK
jgi:hypothetical protein